MNLRFVLNVSHYYKTVFLLILSLGIKNGLCSLGNPQFVEPIKNMTVHTGTNVDLSCIVQNLGNHRVMWLKKEGGKDEFVGINNLKITKNPRVSLSVMQSSGDVTQSNLYIYNVHTEDSGAYECGVNTNPMISQTGLLDITSLEDHQIIIEPRTTQIPLESSSANDPCEVNKDSPNCLKPQPLPELTSNNIICIDFPKLWEKTRSNVKEIMTTIYTSLVKITSSFFN